MTLSGYQAEYRKKQKEKVLIPLLVDDPLWDESAADKVAKKLVLIPLLVDDPLWVHVRLLRNVFNES